jgi:hypothetical protein
METIEGRKTTALDKHCHCARRALIAQDIMVDPITMVEVLSKPNGHAWPMYPLKLTLQVLIETKHRSLQLHFKEQRQSTPNGCLK